MLTSEQADALCRFIEQVSDGQWNHISAMLDKWLIDRDDLVDACEKLGEIAGVDPPITSDDV